MGNEHELLDFVGRGQDIIREALKDQLVDGKAIPIIAGTNLCDAMTEIAAEIAMKDHKALALLAVVSEDFGKDLHEFVHVCMHASFQLGVACAVDLEWA